VPIVRHVTGIGSPGARVESDLADHGRAQVSLEPGNMVVGPAPQRDQTLIRLVPAEGAVGLGLEERHTIRRHVDPLDHG
jgi:hypothetical protein